MLVWIITCKCSFIVLFASVASKYYLHMLIESTTCNCCFQCLQANADSTWYMEMLFHISTTKCWFQLLLANAESNFNLQMFTLITIYKWCFSLLTAKCVRLHDLREYMSTTPSRMGFCYVSMGVDTSVLCTSGQSRFCIGNLSTLATASHLERGNLQSRLLPVVPSKWDVSSCIIPCQRRDCFN